MIDTSVRSLKREIMDDLDMDDPILLSTLDKIASINKNLGGNSVTTNGIKKLLGHSVQIGKEVKILDVGCGNGAVLRSIAKYCLNNEIKASFIGIDANQTTIDYAIKQSRGFNNVSFIKMDIFSEQLANLEYDIATATLFLHHFNDNEIKSIMSNLIKHAKIGVVINDLHRSKTAYFLFKCITLFTANKMVKNDGAISILRAFKRKDLLTFSQQLKIKASIRWKWAFRYQWIIQK